MAQHAILTNKSNQRIAAAVAVSGLVGTGLAVPFAQVALAVPNPCTVNYDGSNDASGTTLRDQIDAAIANVSCSVIEINNTIDEPLELFVEDEPIYVGPSNSVIDTRTSITIKSTTGLDIKPYSSDVARHTGTLMRLQDESSWESSSSLCLSASSSSINCTGMNSLLSNITIEGLTFRDSEGSAIDGREFGDDLPASLEIDDSRFISNSTENSGVDGSLIERGGAVGTVADVNITRSIFIDNHANWWGGAVWTYGNAYISNSLFINNDSDRHGGAVYAGDPVEYNFGRIYAVNSSFLFNHSSDVGGALYTGDGETELVLNTFFENTAGSGPYSHYSIGQTQLWGNIFANQDWATQQDVDTDSEDLGYNIFTQEPEMSITSSTSRTKSLDDIAFEYDTRVTSEGEALDAAIEMISNASTPVLQSPTFTITPSSVGAGFVKEAFPSDFFSVFFDDKISVDQLGNSRTLPFDAGAHQVTLRRSSGGTAAVVATPITPKEALVPGFAPNSTKLTKSMKKEIKAFLKANPDFKNVVCKGYTSSPSTPQDRALARKRGKVACDYILTLRPDAQVTIRSGSHTNKPGSQIRRVNIKLS